VAPANNAPDPGETITANFPLINTGDGNTSNLVATLQSSGGVTPVTATANYGVVVAAGPAVTRPFTFVTSGACGSTVTATLQLQDGAINLGTVAYSFQLGTTSSASSTFSNATAIVIPATGTGATTGAPATPYPSNITVAGITAPVSKVTVTLKQITHTFPSDVDVLLVGPTGVKFILLSDVIGGTDWTGQTYTIDDGAAALLPSSGTPPASGSFKPTDYGTGDVFPAPAPASPYLDPATAGAATLAAFNGLNPNGTWSLYVVDDAGTDIGTFAGGWDLSITTTQSICNTQTCSVTCPANISVPESPSGSGGAVVNYPGATPTGACGVLGYSTPSGSTFPIGTTMVTVTGANAATCQFSVTVTGSGPVTTAGQLLISEFRVRGPSGANDEFIDLYNTTGASLTTQAADASAGLAVAASDGTARCVIPNGTLIPAGGHFLCSNSMAYSISGYPSGNGTTATGNLTYTTDIPDNAGIALFNNSTGGGSFSVANRLDAVGSTSEANTTYKEGTGYPALTPFSIDYSFVRKLPGGCTGSGTSPSGNCNSVALIQTTPGPTSTQPQDTGNNAADFIFVDTNGTSAGAGQRLGAPGPQNLSGPGVLDGAASLSLFDSCVAANADPNFVRDLTSVPANNSTFGTVDLRRTFTNNTGGNITRLRFRIVDITTFPSISGVADLRPLTSSTISVTGDKPPCGGSTASYSVQGTTLEQPPSQPNGSGYNGSLSVGTITTGTPLAAGASVDFRMVSGVQQTGAARMCVVAETLPVSASQVSCFLINDTNPPTCNITCPANITQGNDLNQCGAVVTYPAPTTTGTCGTINCAPASGSFFPVGTTNVNCTSTAGPSCSFTVTVNDTQPPSITCPANIVVPPTPGFDGATVNYPAPTVSDNCPGVPAPVCTPAAGSFFPIGVTTVTCSVGGSSCVNKTITHSSSQAITPLNSVSCNDGFGHTDNHYWRAFNLPSFSVTGTFHVSSIDIGIEQATAGAGPAPAHQSRNVTRNNARSAARRQRANTPEGTTTQPMTVLLHTNTGGAFPAGTLNFLNSVTVNVADQAGTVLNVPLTADVPAGSELVVEVFTPDGTATGNLIFIGSNAAAETGPSYLSAPDCGVNSPTTTAALGFPDMHIVMNVNGCEDTTGGSSASCNFTVTVKPPRYWTTVGAAGTTDEDSTALVSHEDFAATIKAGLTGTATVRYNITAVQGISAYCPATQSIVYVRFRNSDNAGTHAQVKFDVHRTSILAGGNDTIFSFNSNGLGAGSNFTSASLSPNIDFDFSNYIYWIEATVFRDQAAQFADLGSIEILESDGTPCP
jgi:subtilisin-like proprotein convertase family protein